jgi:hypothetical protein
MPLSSNAVSCIARSCITAAMVAALSLSCGGRTADPGGSSSGSGGGSGGSGGSSGGGPGSGGFPFAGPSCEAPYLPDTCWPCLQQSCGAQVECFTSQCGSFFMCFCACAAGDNSCEAQCANDALPACQTCLQDSTCTGSTCQSSCTVAGVGGGSSGGGSSTSGSSSGSSGGPGVEQECAGTTCSNGQSFQSCQNLTNGVCTSEYYQVGAQTFPCASCTDTASCAQAAAAACQ